MRNEVLVDAQLHWSSNRLYCLVGALNYIQNVALRAQIDRHSLLKDSSYDVDVCSLKSDCGSLLPENFVGGSDVVKLPAGWTVQSCWYLLIRSGQSDVGK